MSKFTTLSLLIKKNKNHKEKILYMMNNAQVVAYLIKSIKKEKLKELKY